MTESTRFSPALRDALTLLQILSLIPRHRSTTIPELGRRLAAEGIEIRPRTLQRYIQSLREHPELFPITVNDAVRPYAIAWDAKGEGLHLPMLGAQDALVLRLAEEELSQRFGAALLQGLKPLFLDAKRKQTVPDPERVHAHSWLRKVKASPSALPTTPPKIKEQVFKNVTTALYLDRMLKIKSRSANGRLMDARVMPLGIAAQDVRLYLIFRFEGQTQTSHLALNRVDEAVMLERSFARPKNFDLEDYCAQASFNKNQGPAVKLVLVTDDPVLVKTLSETPFNRTQTIERMKGEEKTAGTRWRISAVLEDSLLLDGWLAMRRASILEAVKTRIDEPAAEAETPTEDGAAESAPSTDGEAPVGDEVLEIANRRLVARPRTNK